MKLSYIPCAVRGCGEPTPLLITHTEDLGLDLGCHHYYETLKSTFSAPTHFYTWELGTKLYQVVEEAKFIVLQNYPEPNYHPLPLIIVIMTNLYIILVPSTALIDPRQDKVNTLCDQNIFSLNASSRTEWLCTECWLVDNKTDTIYITYLATKLYYVVLLVRYYQADKLQIILMTIVAELLPTTTLVCCTTCRMRVHLRNNNNVVMRGTTQPVWLSPW